jgi:hypothetical protein
LKLSGMFLLRLAQRAFLRLLFQEPPRDRSPALQKQSLTAYC